ncbi:MAG: ThiF family adenylyltransferase [Syntrophobacterales bacterium]|jgi:molybdopterin/thiamine biosynthesis adenylyltransferase|nr:ThiF family adenylyltransferase [Syntrophobacterales bacterium]
MLEIKAIGIGGIGCALLPFLCRFLQYANEPARLTLIDGDRFERSNAARQAFSRLGNKAEVKALELAQEFEALAFRSAPEYVTEDNAARLILPGDLVFLMVDNHASRGLVSRHAANLADLTLISGGNDYEDGNVQIYVRKQGQDLTPALTRYHPEIAAPQDQNPATMSCEELMAAGAPQLLFTNLMVASLMLNAFYALRQGQMNYSEVYLDILQNVSRAVARPV